VSWADLLRRGRKDLSLHISSFTEVLEDGIRKSVWRFVYTYFRALSCWLLDLVFPRMSFVIRFRYWDHVYDFSQSCVSVRLCVCVCVCECV
jgi:hypothetical protein